MKIAGTGVIAQALPELLDIILAGSSQITYSRIVLHEPFPIFPTLSNTGLLKDDFAQPDGIGIPGFAPRQISAVLTKPMEYFC